MTQLTIGGETEERERRLRLALRSWWGLGEEQGIESFQEALAGVRGAEGELPEGRIREIIEAEALAWTRVYHRCPWCGSRSPHPLILPLGEVGG